MKTLLKKNLRKIIIYGAVLLILLISMCFSTYIDIVIQKGLANKKHIIANDKMIVHFINVNQADAVAINFPNGEVALIDTGSVYSANSLIKYLDTYVIPFSDGSIDYLFYSHADNDHTGGIKSVLHNYKVKNIIRPRQYATFESLTSEYEAYFKDEDYSYTMSAIYNEVEKEGAKLIKAEDLLQFNVGNVKIDIYYPLIKVEDSNNFSYFIKIEYNGFSLLFTGDADANIEKKMIEKHENDLDCDILKVAHHGSNTSSTSQFLQVVTPQYAVISVGKNNYGHPSSEVINNLYASGVNKILRTDLDGDILFTVDKDIDLYVGEYYISKIEFKYYKLSWIIVFMLICYGTYWFVITFKQVLISKIKHK